MKIVITIEDTDVGVDVTAKGTPSREGTNGPNSIALLTFMQYLEVLRSSQRAGVNITEGGGKPSWATKGGSH